MFMLPPDLLLNFGKRQRSHPRKLTLGAEGRPTV
jgi:hypothetical protein